MKSTPILFSRHMVQAHLRHDDPKTQTRRILKPQPPNADFSVASYEDWEAAECSSGIKSVKFSTPFEQKDRWDWWPHGYKKIQCPYGQPGDELWAKETFRCDLHSDFDPAEKNRIQCRGHYAADNQEFSALLTPAESEKFHQWQDQQGTKPSLFMFRSLSRIIRTITDVRVQRLQDITEKDAEAEGVAFLREHPDADETLTARQLYKILWNSLNLKPKPVYGPGPDGKPKILHYVSYPWAMEDLADLRSGTVLQMIQRTLQDGEWNGYSTVQQGNTFIHSNAVTKSALHIIPNPWVWALTYR